VNLAVLAGVGFGAALWLLWSGLAPAREPLARTLDRLGNPEAVVPTGVASSLDARLGAQLRRLGPVERLVELVRADLRVLRRDPDEQVAEIAGYGMVGFLFAPAVVAGAWFIVDIQVPLVVPFWLSLVGAAVTVVLAVRQVRQRAALARSEFCHSLSAYCDVVAMTLSAGRELHTALFDAAAQGDGWAWRELRDGLQRGFLLGEQPWEALTRLGQSLGVTDLVELGATLALADEEGASVADTVTAKAASLRERLVAEAEMTAAAVTERMAVPGAMILLGFLGFVIFPAVYLILQEAG
jgi:tight adherence protein C